ncbi:MAG TPA: hypothetical protein VND92_09580 [Vicinamibacterales bacterium]|nr:hypothetical protein [Vicinamibacterales bacterium]
MTPGQAIVEDVLRSTRLAGAARRQDVTEELRAHIEDLVDEARAAGVRDVDIPALVAARFGDPDVVGRQFSRVYRANRWLAAAAAFSLLGLVSVLVACGLVYGVQIWLTLSLGFVPTRAMSSRHWDTEGLLLAGVTLGYVALFSLGRREQADGGHRLLKPLALVAGGLLPAGVVLALWRPDAAILLAAALACAAVVRALEVWLPPITIRLAGLLAFFWFVGGFVHESMARAPATQVWLMMLPVGAAIALASQCTISITGLFDRRILSRHLV